MTKIKPTQYTSLVGEISSLLAKGRKQAYRAVDNILVTTYWNIGRQIVEFEQKGNKKAEYGAKLLKELSRDLTRLHGKGFSRSNLQNMRLLYI